MMKTVLSTFIFILLILASSLVIPAHAQERPDRLTGQLLVKLKSPVLNGILERDLRGFGVRATGRINALDINVLSVPEAVEDLVAAVLSKHPMVEFVEADGVAYADYIPSDPAFAPYQWGLENTGQTIGGVVGTVDADIDASAAWDVATGSGVKVAILDTGIDQNHEDVSSKIVLQKNFTKAPNVDDFYGHGTHVSGIVAAVGNSVGVIGGCPACQLMNGKVLGDDGSGAYSWVANGITWAADNGAKVINMSLGGSFKSRTLENAVNYAWNKGVIVVAAAGNSNNPSKTYPAAYVKAIAVAATNNKDKKASFSSYGSWVDVAAPGENIYSTFPNHSFVIGTNYGRSQNYDFASGTSMATPMVAAVAGLVWSTPYGTSATAVRNRIESTAQNISGTGTYWSKGRVNAAASVAP